MKDKNSLIASTSNDFRARANAKSAGCRNICNNKEKQYTIASCKVRSGFKVFGR